MLSAHADADLGAHAFVGVGLEAGRVLKSVSGVVGGQTEVEIGGFWLSAAIAVGLRL
jgi:hypothetical protein